MKISRHFSASHRASVRRSAGAFSLVEVTVALGILAFCMVAILGMVPVGLSSQQSAQEESRAVAVLNMTNTAVRSLALQNGSSTTYEFPKFFSDTTTARTLSIGGTASTYAFFLLEDGSIRKASDTTSPVRQILFVEITPPASSAQPARVYAAVAWPWKPTDKSTLLAKDLKGRQGFVDAVINYALR